MEMMFSNRTSCYQTEKITTVKYPGLEHVPMGERKLTSIELDRKVMTPYSRLGTFHFSETSSVTSTTECPRTECTLVACTENAKLDDGLVDKTQLQ